MEYKEQLVRLGVLAKEMRKKRNENFTSTFSQSFHHNYNDNLKRLRKRLYGRCVQVFASKKEQKTNKAFPLREQILKTVVDVLNYHAQGFAPLCAAIWCSNQLTEHNPEIIRHEQNCLLTHL